MITIADYYKKNKPTVANSKDFDFLFVLLGGGSLGGRGFLGGGGGWGSGMSKLFT